MSNAKTLPRPHLWPRSFRLPVTGAVLLALLWTGHARPAELKRDTLRIGLTQSRFAGMNRNDMEASFKAFMATVGRKRGYELQPIVTVFEDNASFDAAIKNKTLNLAIIDAWHFVSSGVEEWMEPVCVPVPKDKVGRGYLILTRRGNDLGSLADLRGREIISLELGSSTMGRAWLDTLLLTNGLGHCAEFFSRVDTTSKPSAAVLPVFFGKKHACLVDTLGFEVMKELNPQMGVTLRAVASSDVFVDTVTCLAREGWTSGQFRRDVAETLCELHLDAPGRQIMTLFKITKLVPYERSHVESVRRLKAQYDQWRPPAPTQPASVADTASAQEEDPPLR